jgi:hypothetical protein
VHNQRRPLALTNWRESDLIALDALGFDLFSVPSFDRVINSDNHLAFGREGHHQKPQQQPTGLERLPSFSVQNAMKVLKMLLIAFAHHAQADSDCTFARRKNRSD